MKLGGRRRGSFGQFGVRLDMHFADEAQAFAGNGADQLLFAATVADRLAGGIDAARQRGVRNDTATPDRRDEIASADDPLAVLQQVNQNVEDLRLDCNPLRAAPQLALFRIKYMIDKDKTHCSAPEGGALND